jgi:hypothetical protein
MDPPLDVIPANSGDSQSNEYVLLEQNEDKSWATFTHSSQPYHGGYSDLSPWRCDPSWKLSNAEKNGPTHKSMFDDMVFYWTQRAKPSQIKDALEVPVNTTYFLNKVVASHWTNLLELAAYTLAQLEYFSSDKGKIGDNASNSQWRKEVENLKKKLKSVDSFRRKLMWCQDELNLNLERLGILPEGGQVPPLVKPISILEAEIDFVAAAARLKLYKERADSLTGIVMDLVSLRGSIKSIDDGAFGLRLSVLGAVVFPVTLVAAIFSMGGRFSPGEEDFWLLFVVAIPLVFIMVVFLVAGNKIWAFFSDFYKSKIKGENPQQ